MSNIRSEVPPLSKAEIAGISGKLRSQFGLQEGCFPLLQFLELIIPKIEEEYIFEVCSTQEMGSNYGLTIPDQKILKLREDVYEGLTQDNGRDRFTAAHELGHYILHRDIPAKFHRHTNEKIPAYRCSEWQANTFASQLLLPDSCLRKDFHLSDAVLATKYGMSMQAIEIAREKINR